MKEREGSAKIYEGRGMGIWLNGWFMFFFSKERLEHAYKLDREIQTPLKKTQIIEKKMDGERSYRR